MSSLDGFKIDKLLSVVVIGLNEEQQLNDSLRSVIESEIADNYELEVIYVDSGSSDRSVEIAKDVSGVKVLHLNDADPSAAKARNLGISQARGKYIQLLDGDSILRPGWLTRAVRYLDHNPEVSCVFGHCVEMYPEKSLYMRLCGLDWHVKPGEYRLCGGNAMWRRCVFEEVGFFDGALRLGEEPDLCYRVRHSGGHIHCIDTDMVKHDLAMNSFGQYWRRAENSGKAYVRVALRYWRKNEKLWLYESVRNFVEPMLWIAIFLLGTLFMSPWIGCTALLVWWFIRGIRTAIKTRSRTASWGHAFLYGLHSQFIRLPIVVGQLKSLVSSR